MNSDFEPKWIALEITKRCNLNCIHCRSSSDPAVQGDLSADLAFKIIDDITSFAAPVMVLSGGEPLLHGDVFEIAGYGTKKGLRMCLATNGTLVTDSVCKKIAGSGIKIVSLSLDGASKDTHDAFRKQGGAFDAAVNASKLFKKHGIEFLINSSFTKSNQGEIEGVYKLSKELGATAWYMFLIVPAGRGSELTDELISGDDYESILEWHYEMEKGERDIIVRPTCAPHYFRITAQKSKDGGFAKRTLKFSTGIQKGCIAGQYIAFIDANLNVLPCSYFPAAAGNLKENTFKEIWCNSKLMNELRDFAKYKGKCGACEFINICGGCRARAYAVRGDYLAEEPFCKYSPMTLKRSAS